VKVFLFTCPERIAEATATLRELEQTDFPGQPFVRMDAGDGLPSAARNARHRRSALAAMLADFPLERLFLMLEDDIEFNVAWWEHLQQWKPLRRERLCASLYRPAGLPASGTLDRCADGPGLGFYGGQAVILSRGFAETVLRRWDDPQPSGLPNWDKRVGAAAAAERLPITYHVPCLVQHRCAPSLVGSVPHRSACFSRFWGERSEKT
jgi:hypothetical protein